MAHESVYEFIIVGGTSMLSPSQEEAPLLMNAPVMTAVVI